MRFNELKNADYKFPTVALFWNTGCAPCERLKPRLREECETLGVRLEEFFLGNNLDAAKELGLRTVPTVVVVHKGSVSVAFAGMVPDIRARLIAAGVTPA